MSFFDAVTNPSFKKDDQGRDVYYPWGNLGKGYIADTPEKYQTLYSFQRKMMKYSMIGFFGTMLLIGPIIPMMALPFYLLWLWRATKSRTKDLRVSGEKIRLKEIQTTTAKGLPMWALVSIVVFSFLLFVLGFGMLFTEVSVQSSLITMAFSGFLVFAYIRMIRLKRSGTDSAAS